MKQHAVRTSDVVGSLLGSVVLHISIAGMFFIATIDTVDTEAAQIAKNYTPAKLVELAKDVAPKKVIKKKRQRVVTKISSRPLKATSSLQDWSAEVDVDELSELKELDDVADFQGAEEVFAEGRAQLQRNEFIANYRARVKERVERVWYQPPGTRLGTSAQVKIQLSKKGTVGQVTLMKSSGNRSFDSSLLEAIRRAHRIPEIEEIVKQSKAIYEEHFASLVLRFIKT